MKSSIFIFLTTILTFVGCSHQRIESNSKIVNLTPEQVMEINRDALALASKRLGEMVAQAKNNQSSLNFLASDLFLKANMSLLEGDYTTAVVLFKHLLDLVPEDSFIQKKYAISLIREGDLKTASVVLDKLYEKSKDPKVGLILAGVYTGIDQENIARKIYRKLLVKNPKDEDACIFLSKSFATSNESSKAIHQLKTCALNDPKNGIYDFYIGKIHLDSGHIPLAIESFKSASTKQPDFAQAVSALGLLLEEREQHDKAIGLYKKYLKNNPNDVSINSRIVEVLFVRERFMEVIPFAEKLMDLQPDNLNLKIKLGILYTDTKKYSEAVSIFKDLLKIAPNSDKILYYLGVIHQEINDYHRSIEYFNQIPVSSALYTDSAVQMANMLSTLAQNDHTKDFNNQSEKKFIKFVNSKIEELKDLRVEFSVIKAGYFEAINNYKGAMETLMVVQDEKNFSVQHKYYLANLFEKEKKYDEAQALIMAIIEKEPKNAHAWNFLGYSLLVRGEDLDQAYKYIQKALEINPTDGYIRDSLGWYYFKKGQVNKALSELEIAFNKVPDDAEIMKHLAAVHKKLKNYRKARIFFQAALKHVRYEREKQEILTQIDELERDRLPASDKN